MSDSSHTQETLESVSIIVKHAFLKCSNDSHQFILSFKDIRSWLLDGDHEMFKVTINEEV